jgi:hypothetical protein
MRTAVPSKHRRHCSHIPEICASLVERANNFRTNLSQIAGWVVVVEKKHRDMLQLINFWHLAGSH